MSTKTSLLKRVAQTAVVALVGGLISTIATPVAQGASNPNVSVSSSSFCVMRKGVGGFISVTYAGAGTGTSRIRWIGTDYSVASDTNTYTYATAFTSAPGYTAPIADTNTSTIIIPLTSETVTGVSSLTWMVWLDVNAGGTSTETSTPGTNSASRTITCTDGGPVASFSLSATSASGIAGDTSTFTVTPKGANGVTTILKPGTESFTIKMTPSAGRAQITAGRLKADGIGTIGGAGLSDTTTYSLGQVSYHRSSGSVLTTELNQRLVVGRVGSLESTSSDSIKVESATTGNMPLGRAGYETGSGNTRCTGGAASCAPNSSNVTISMDATMADALPTYQLTSGALSSTVVGESVTATGAYTIQLRADSNTTTTAVVAGAGGIANSVTATYTLTTVAQVYGTGYGFGSSTAIVAPGYGIVISGTGWSSTASDIGLTSPTAASTSGMATADQTVQVSTARTTIPLTVQMSQSGTFQYTVAAVTGYTVPTGVTAGTFTYSSVAGETQAAITWTISSPTDGQRFTVAFSAAAATTRTITVVIAAPRVGSSDGTVVFRDTASSKKYSAGATNTAVATVRDQYGSLVSGAPVTFSVSGRNIVAATNVNTLANGTATFSYTDKSTSTTSLTDTVAASATFGNSGSFKSATSTTYTASTTALAATAISATANAASTGVSANGSVTLTITVQDASGLATGYPVTVTTDSKSFVTTVGETTGNFYTDSNGVATATVYAKTLGSSTVTITSAGKSTTVTYTVIAGSHRTVEVNLASVSMTPEAAKNVVATVKDSFGNVDEGVAVTVAYVGTAGRVASVNGVASSTCTTDANGQCTIQLVSEVAGTGTLTVTISGGDALTTVLNDGSARPTRVLTASTAVTITGSSATVTAVTAAQAAADAATDAALQAIDAANAATDAANLAAEAADAATVAAQEAKDSADAATAAVESLATQVATLMAALQAQVTSLANVVAKIAKKVKA